MPYVFLTWLIGLPILLMADSYIKGRFKKSIFAATFGDEWSHGASVFFWPIYFACMSIYHGWNIAGDLITGGMANAMDYFEKKGKQAGDIDYQIEKHLSEDE